MSAQSPMVSADPIEVIVLNGASSAGKTTLAAALQVVLDDTWLVFGVDTLITALGLPLLEMHDEATIRARPSDHAVRDGGITFDADGGVSVGGEYRRLETAWLKGLSSIVASGVRLILDEVFLDGARSQDRLGDALDGHRVAWVAVTCEFEVATNRERVRGDRVVGMYERQATRVHDGVHYDLVLDTTSRSPEDLARTVAHQLQLATA
jgi:chloramphenicol 3-O phosphotransferase